MADLHVDSYTAKDIAKLLREWIRTDATGWPNRNLDDDLAIAAGFLESLAGPVELPAVLFDGYAVYQELPQDVRGWTSAENVSAVLDAVVRILKRECSSATQHEGEQK